MNNIFKVGDKVKITSVNTGNKGYCIEKGLTHGEVISISNAKDYYGVVGNLDDFVWHMHKSDIQLITENMNKYNIEVGDIIKIILEWKVVEVTDKGISILAGKHTGFDTWSKINDRLDSKKDTLIKMNKKIIGYKLLKDTPDLDKGTVFHFNTGEMSGEEQYMWRTDIGDDWSYYSQAQVEKKEWFEPIYETKPTEVFVDTLAGKVQIMKEFCSLKGETLSTNLVEDYLNNVKSWDSEDSFPYNLRVDTFKLGCQTFSHKDINPLLLAIKQVS